MSTGPSYATSGALVVNAVDTAWGDTKKLLTFGMIILPGDTDCLSRARGSYGTFVTGLAVLTDGIVGSICSDDFAPTLGLLANHARTLLDYVQLKYLPVKDSMKVRFIPDHTTTWRAQGRRIYFNNPPPKGTIINIDYTIL
jgi:hypothetical protein